LLVTPICRGLQAQLVALHVSILVLHGLRMPPDWLLNLSRCRMCTVCGSKHPCWCSSPP
jgi:hypothetical protein